MDVDCSDLDAGKEEEEVENQTEKNEKSVSGKTLIFHELTGTGFKICVEHIENINKVSILFQGMKLLLL